MRKQYDPGLVVALIKLQKTEIHKDMYTVAEIKQRNEHKKGKNCSKYKVTKFHPKTLHKTVKQLNYSFACRMTVRSLQANETLLIDNVLFECSGLPLKFHYIASHF